MSFVNKIKITMDNFIGPVGLAFFGRNRVPVMILAISLNLLTFVFFCVGLGGSTSDQGNITNCAWMSRDFKLIGENYIYYIGTTNMVATNDDGDFLQDSEVEFSKCASRKTTTNDDDNFAQPPPKDVCSDCNDAGTSAVAFLAVAFILVFPILICSFFRMSQARESGTIKAITLLSLLLSVLFIAIAMSSWVGCRRAMDSEYDANDMSYGPGFVVLGLSIITMGLQLLIHGLTPTKND